MLGFSLHFLNWNNDPKKDQRMGFIFISWGSTMYMFIFNQSLTKKIWTYGLKLAVITSAEYNFLLACNLLIISWLCICKNNFQNCRFLKFESTVRFPNNLPQVYPVWWWIVSKCQLKFVQIWKSVKNVHVKFLTHSTKEKALPFCLLSRCRILVLSLSKLKS